MTDEIRLLFNLAKRIRTPIEAALLLLVCLIIVALIYLIPADAIDD